jgi:para-aminobenzoate synthetase / 4-amino-4-deoxychorismate lyase
MGTHRSRPDQSRGVFETLLVSDGRPVELAAHLARLGRSVRALYGADVPPGAEEAIHDAARGVALGRLRLDAVPTDGSLATSVRVATVEPETVFPEAGVRVTPLTVAGGWGAHKWADRGLLDGGNGSLPLVVDHDRVTVLEASRANVFIVELGRLVTPPADGRILPGVTRARLLALLDVREEIVSLDRLAEADEVFLSGSVRGVEAVSVCGGRRIWTPGPVTRAVGAQLKRHWEGEQ